MSDILPKSLKDVINNLSVLPGIGPKTATRLAYFLLKAPDSYSEKLSDSLVDMKKEIKFCSVCHSISSSDVCSVCSDDGRNRDVICVIEESLDLVAIEKSGVYNGLYHVLGGVISPMNGIGPEELYIEDLLKRIKKDEGVKEVILATNPNLEGEATSMYISKKIVDMEEDIVISNLGRGLPTGSDLEYADSLTLKKSIEGRTVFQKKL